MSAATKLPAQVWALLAGVTAALLGALAFIVLPQRHQPEGRLTAPERTHQPVNTTAQVALNDSDARARHNLAQLEAMAEEANAGERPNIAALVEAGRK